MKFTALLVSALLGASAAFAPASSSKSASTTTALNAESNPFGAAPFPGGAELFLGKAEWNRLTKDIGTEETGTYMRAA